MQGIWKALVVAVALSVVVGGSLFATPNLIQSPQRQSTAGQLWSDGDNFIDPRGFANMEFDRWFGLVSFDTVQMARIGFATRFDGLYVALFYGGNAWNIPAHSFEERQLNFFGTQRSMRFYMTPGFPAAGGTMPDNSISLLVGVADMGFRLSCRATRWSRRINEDFQSGASGNFYRSFREQRGSINPELAWGMTRELIPGMGVRPHAYLDFDFYRDNLRFEQYTTSSTVLDHVVRSNNSMTLGLTAAMGGLYLMREDGFDFGVDLWYSLTLPMFNNEFNYLDGAGNQRVGSGLRGMFSAAANDFTEISANHHEVTPTAFAFWGGDRIMFAMEFALGLGFGGIRTSEMAPRPGTSTLVKDGLELSTRVFSILPALGIGLQWAVVPDRFFLNAGGLVEFGRVHFETIDFAEYADNVRVAGSSGRIVDHSFFAASTMLRAGVTFQMTPNFGIQANSGIDTNNVVNLFNTGSTNGLAAFSEILVTARF